TTQGSTDCVRCARCLVHRGNCPNADPADSRSHSLECPRPAESRRVVSEESRWAADDRSARSTDAGRHAADFPAERERSAKHRQRARSHRVFVCGSHAKMKELETAGVKIVTPVREVAGLF